MRNVLITGASRGLGRQIALLLSEKDYAIAINYHKSEKEAKALLKTLKPALVLKADVGDIKQVYEIEKEIRKKWGRIDAIINNAGITRDNLLIKTGEAEWDAVIRTNLTGCFNVIKVFSPLLIDSGGGHIINISSYSGIKGRQGQSAYSASKAGIIGLTHSSAKELGRYNIKVNAVTPGYMATDMGNLSHEAEKKARDMSILGRLSDAKEVSGFIAYLIGTENITGQVFSLESRK